MKVLWVATMVALAAAPALAADRIYECDFPDHATGGHGWTSGPLVFVIEGDDRVATVNSGPIAHFVGQPIEAKVNKDLPNLIALSFEVEGKDNANQHARMGYRLKVMEGGAKAVLTAQPFAFDNIWSNEGTCKKVKS